MKQWHKIFLLYVSPAIGPVNTLRDQGCPKIYPLRHLSNKIKLQSIISDIVVLSVPCFFFKNLKYIQEMQ